MSPVLSLAPVYLLGLGLVVAAAALPRGLPDRGGHAELAATLSGLATLGLLVNYLLVLGLGSLTLALGVGAPLAAAGVALGVRARRRRRVSFCGDLRTWAWGLPLAGIVALYGVLILTQPLSHWDPRTVWFFHAKIIYHAGALTGSSGWDQLPPSHADYPKLLQTLAAQVAYVAGFWNEFLPKLALLVLLVPVALGYFAFLRRPLSWLFLIAMAFFPTYIEIWDGKADSYLALYGGLALLALSRWLDERCAHDLLLGLVALGVVACLKNEGALLLGACAAGGLAASRLQARAPGPRRWWPWLYLGSVALAGLPIWWLKRRAWGLHPDLELSPAYVLKAWERLLDGDSLQQILEVLLYTRELAYVVVPLVLALVAARWLRVVIPPTLVLPVVAATLYFSAILFVYLGTPYELGWHLDTSARRTVLPVALALAVATFQVMEALEGTDGRTAAAR